jgi:hypothetical protein
LKPLSIAHNRGTTFPIKRVTRTFEQPLLCQHAVLQLADSSIDSDIFLLSAAVKEQRNQSRDHKQGNDCEGAEAKHLPLLVHYCYNLLGSVSARFGCSKLVRDTFISEL